MHGWLTGRVGGTKRDSCQISLQGSVACVVGVANFGDDDLNRIYLNCVPALTSFA
jgi:hypothetical protein